jgi:hypothetical protein
MFKTKKNQVSAASLRPSHLASPGRSPWRRSVVGHCYTPGPGYRAVYDVDKMIETLVKRDGMTWEEAWEYFEFNTEGSYVGEKTPIFWRKLQEE